MSVFPHTKTSYQLSFGGKLLYLTCIFFVWFLSIWPLRLLYLLNWPLYLILYKAVGYRKKIVRKNLTESFPGKSEKEILQIEHRFYHWLCDQFMETIKTLSISKKEMRERVTFHGMEHIRKLLDNNKNVAVYLGHYGNWEWVTSIGLHLPPGTVCQVYHELESPVMDSVMLKIRESMDTTNVSMPNILRHIVRCRKENRNIVCGFISDQVPLYGSTHYWTNFLNHKETLVLTGTERLAKQCNFGCVYLDISMPKRGHYDIQVIPMTDGTEKNIPDWEITEQYFRLLEKSIQRDPAIWLWSHNRWKRTVKGFEEWCSFYKVDPKERAFCYQSME